MIVTAIRLYLIYVVDFNDLSHSVVRSTYLTIIQPGIAMMVACSPLLKPIMDIWIPSLRTQTGASTNTSAQPHNSNTNSIRSPIKRHGRHQPGLSFLSHSGFDRMSESDQELVLELGVPGTHETHVSVYGIAPPDRSPGAAPRANNGGIMVTRQTVVATSVQGIDDTDSSN